ncbi:MAG: low molecular weight protein arginine phosphatase [bacterium]|nr:low molecular weight protein arginine phosphatase [bacterium]
MKMILFVCTGNTCRSPMAEIYFNDQIRNIKNIGFYAESAGIMAGGENRISEYASHTLDQYHVRVPGSFRSTALTRDLLRDSEYAYFMEQKQKEYVLENYPEFSNKIFLLSEINREEYDIKDPAGDSLSSYEKSFLEIKKYIDILIKQLKN